MRIIKHCDYDKVVACECCGTTFEIDDTDLITDADEIHLLCGCKVIYHTYAQCPVCNTHNGIKFIKSEEENDDLLCD